MSQSDVISPEKIRQALQIGKELEEKENRLIQHKKYYKYFHYQLFASIWHHQTVNIVVPVYVEEIFLKELLFDSSLTECKFTLIVECISENCAKKFAVNSCDIMKWNLNRRCRECCKK